MLSSLAAGPGKPLGQETQLGAAGPGEVMVEMGPSLLRPQHLQTPGVRCPRPGSRQPPRPGTSQGDPGSARTWQPPARCPRLLPNAPRLPARASETGQLGRPDAEAAGNRGASGDLRPTLGTPVVWELGRPG